MLIIQNVVFQKCNRISFYFLMENKVQNHIVLATDHPKAPIIKDARGEEFARVRHVKGASPRSGLICACLVRRQAIPRYAGRVLDENRAIGLEDVSSIHIETK